MSEIKKTLYLNLITKSEKEQQSEDLQFREEEAQLKLDNDILSTKRAIVKAKKDVQNAIIAYPFNSQSILDAKEELQSLENGLVELEKLKKELF